MPAKSDKKSTKRILPPPRRGRPVVHQGARTITAYLSAEEIAFCRQRGEGSFTAGARAVIRAAMEREQ